MKAVCINCNQFVDEHTLEDCRNCLIEYDCKLRELNG